MRIVAGEWRGRTIYAPRGRDTRPTSDRVREAVFSALTSHLGGLDGQQVIDLFAGSGALGLEALSRGAAHATFVENSRPALDALRANIDTLGANARSTVLPVDAMRLPVSGFPGAPFSLLFADPPYRIDSAQVSVVFTQLANAGALAPDALVVYEHAAGTELPVPEGFTDETTRLYGSTGVTVARFGR